MCFSNTQIFTSESQFLRFDQSGGEETHRDVDCADENTELTYSEHCRDRLAPLLYKLLYRNNEFEQGVLE